MLFILVIVAFFSPAVFCGVVLLPFILLCRTNLLLSGEAHIGDGKRKSGTVFQIFSFCFSAGSPRSSPPKNRQVGTAFPTVFFARAHKMT
jgi:hypothetical protein